MAHELRCPHCGCPLLATTHGARVPEVDTIEALRNEIDHLRTTIARLRGAGFNPIRRSPQANPAAPASWTAPASRAGQPGPPSLREGSGRAG
jgi:hypothetical protein